ncbi:C40 family peptidase [Georgenia thermotolerans]|uniref:Glycoside hydrolase n=1 Tax=Georgenia thermotolerans TaxID=527326 RepID=A0A7J5UQY0_9MICO|nr:C40 family peptidase [Georgenia thermotolerans]KAE8764828.1 glycoside hydrolase [Georgenia thermotolerans]
MSTSASVTARHRRACRPSTPLTDFGERLSGTGARRGLATVATSGLVLSLAATSASAAETSALPRVDVSAAAAEAVTAMITTPSVVAPADVTWSVDELEVAVRAPRVVAVERPAAAASRSGERPALAAALATEAPARQAAPAPLASASAVVNYARQFVGTPYVYGGVTPAGFDCSGFTQYVFAHVGISLPRSSSDQRYAGTVVSAAEARPGDLVWWPGHVGIYTGGGNHIAARQPGTALHEGKIPHSSPTFIRVG